MSISFNCACGQPLQVGDDQAGRAVRCPKCHQTIQVPPAGMPAPLQYAGAGQVFSGGPIAPPPGNYIATPRAVPEKFRSPGLPPVYLILWTQGAEVNASFDASPAMDSLVEGFAKKLRKRHDVQIVAAPPPGAPFASIRLVRIDEGNRFLRYFLTLFAGKTHFEIEGEIQTVSGQRTPLYEKQKGMGGIMGGAAINLLKQSAKVVGTRVAKKVLK